MSLKPKKQKKYINMKLTKAKLLAFGGLLFTLGVVTSVTTTYAWYNLTQVATIGNLFLKIDEQMDASLELKLVKNQYRDEVKDASYDDIDVTYLKSSNDEEGFSAEDLGIKKDGIAIKLNDVSGMWRGDWTGESLPRLSSAPRSYAPQNEKGKISRRDNDVYVQNIFYVIAGEDASIYLDGTSDEEHMPLYTNIQPSKKNIDEARKGEIIDAKKLEELNDVVHTVRVSFLVDDNYYVAKLGFTDNFGKCNPYKTVDYETYYAGTLDMDLDGYIDVDADNNEILYGEHSCAESEIVRTTAGETTPLVEDQRTTFNGVSKKDANAITNIEELKKQGKIKKEESVLLRSLMYDSEQPHLKPTPLCTVKANEPKRIVVTIYVEGWDEHMTDAINNASFDISLSFLALFDQ